MQPIPNPAEAQQLAQELVTKVQQIKQLNAEVNQLKLELHSAATGGIQCDGGRVVFVDEGLALQFDRTSLMTQLMSQLHMTAERAEAFIDTCKTEKSKAAYISVYLD